MTTTKPQEIGSIRVIGKHRYILKAIKDINNQRQCIVGLHECWHKWMPTRDDWTVTPTFYVEVV